MSPSVIYKLYAVVLCRVAMHVITMKTYLITSFAVPTLFLFTIHLAFLKDAGGPSLLEGQLTLQLPAFVRQVQLRKNDIAGWSSGGSCRGATATLEFSRRTWLFVIVRRPGHASMTETSMRVVQGKHGLLYGRAR